MIDDLLHARSAGKARTIRRFVPPWPGGLHGATWNDARETLWLAALAISALVEVDPKDNFRIGRIVPHATTGPMDLTLKDSGRTADE